MEDKGWVLVTGCSSGIGKALVGALQKAGWSVVATARRLEALGDIPASNTLRTLSLDVTDPASIERAVASCQDLRLIALINNAGYGQMGPLELLEVSELRAQMETNVMGLHAVTRALLPIIRKNAGAGEGRIVHVSSVLGRLSIPMAGAYNASKHAVTALGETLSMELGEEIPVVLVEPGAIKSQFRATIRQAWGDLPARAAGSRYEKAIEEYASKREDFALNHGMSTQACAEKIVKAISRERPPRKVIIGPDSFWGQLAHRLVPSWLFERVMRRTYGLDG